MSTQSSIIEYQDCRLKYVGWYRTLISEEWWVRKLIIETDFYDFLRDKVSEILIFLATHLLNVGPESFNLFCHEASDFFESKLVRFFSFLCLNGFLLKMFLDHSRALFSCSFFPFSFLSKISSEPDHFFQQIIPMSFGSRGFLNFGQTPFGPETISLEFGYSLHDVSFLFRFFDYLFLIVLAFGNGQIVGAR